MAQKEASFTALFLPRFIAGLLILSIGFYALYYVEFSQALKEEELRDSSILETISHDYHSKFEPITSDLLFLSRSHEAGYFIESKEESYRADLMRDFVNFAKTKKVYNQLRLLDANGQEVIRINNSNGEAEPVEKEKLQNKQNRYYFKETVKLKKGEIFVSPLDLNM